jgi:hypothetical protein
MGVTDVSRTRDTQLHAGQPLMAGKPTAGRYVVYFALFYG